jgi:hypothetical protein
MIYAFWKEVILIFGFSLSCIVKVLTSVSEKKSLNHGNNAQNYWLPEKKKSLAKYIHLIQVKKTQRTDFEYFHIKNSFITY